MADWINAGTKKFVLRDTFVEKVNLNNDNNKTYNLDCMWGGEGRS